MNNTRSDMAIEAAARVAHEVNRAFCANTGDHSHLPWDEAPEWQRTSVIAGVRNVLNNPYLTPAMSHQAWLDAKRADGWVYGEVKDPERKQHPCFRPYDELPPFQKAKDTLFITVVKAILLPS